MWRITGNALTYGAVLQRNEKVGVYGFIFWRDSGWVDVVIDE